MSAFQDFETALNEVVQAKRLSQSKMTKLTELAMKLMDQDTQLVSTMYRTHKALPASCKISSLYVFDALARAARQQVIKHNLSERHATGNCATFLSKVAGVLEGLFQDILATGLPEAKEKTKKIYDIWVKGNTFSPNILGRLSDVVSGKDKESEVNTSVTTDPRIIPQTNPTVSTPNPVVSTPTDTQATLLALLTQAANHQIPQTTVNTAPSPITPLDPAQLAILQYLQSASVNTTTASQISPTTTKPVSDTRISQTATDPRTSRSPSAQVHAEPSYARQTKRHDSYRSPPRNDSYHDSYGDRAHTRNDPKGGFHRRGRWNRWDEREPMSYRDHKQAGWSPRSGGRSRSHSPDGRSYRRHSPPPPSPRSRYHDDNSTSYTTSRNSGKDEFGRDLRSPSLDRSPTSGSVSNQLPNISPVTPSTPHDSKAEFSSTSTSNDLMSRSSSIAANTFSKDPDASDTSLESSNKAAPRTGLENFDMSTFDPTSPASWEALGKMWEVTNGYAPSTEELMQFMMMGAMSQSTSSKNWQQQGSMGPSRTSGYTNDPGRGSFARGRGGYGGHHGNTRSNHHGWTGDRVNGESTDAVILGGGEMDLDTGEVDIHHPQSVSSGSRSGGKMQKVGDRWVFVRNDGVA